MKKVKSFIITLMIIFTGSCIGSALREYNRFKSDKAIYENAGVDWEETVTNAMTRDLIWWGAVMLILAVALVIAILCVKKKDRQEEAE